MGDSGDVGDSGDGSMQQRPPDARRIMSRMFASVAAAVPMARAWTRRQLHRAQVDEDTIERVELMVTEAVTNVVQHTDMTEFVVRVDVDDGLEVAVHDGDPRPPSRRDATQVDTSGRGLLLIEAMADAWGTRAARTGSYVKRQAGKWVWFRIDRSGPKR